LLGTVATSQGEYPDEEGLFYFLFF
jgi:hypothetical protein